MKPILLVLFMLLCGTLARAQSDITATIVDTTGTTLPGANAILLRKSDTLLTSFGTTDGQGEFVMQQVPPGDYLLRLSFLGYERNDQQITVSESDQYLGLGQLMMYPAGFLLEGIEVTADRIPIRMKGDTMLYDAGAFAVGENAKVEDLLRRLPGMSIDANGQITWRGRPVQEVMINGKPFFASNSSLITQNLDAKALKNVEVFDQKSDSEEITGVDDGTENTTVNLEMKEDFKAKVFGELYAGGGTAAGDDDPRYDGGGKLFRITDQTQIGLLGTINNVNRVGFTGDELLTFNRSSGRGSWYSTGGGGLPYYDGGQTPGQNRSIATGINFGRSIGEGGQLTMDYTLFDRQQTQRQTQRQAFTRTGQEREVKSQQIDADDNYNHRIGIRFEQELDTTSRLNFRANASYGGNETRSNAQTLISGRDGVEQEYTVDEISDGNAPSGSASLNYNRRIGSKKGRTFGAGISGSYDEDLTDLQVFTQGLEEGADNLNIIGSLQNGRQLQDRRNSALNYDGTLEYVEPLTEKLGLETRVLYTYDETEGDFTFRLNEQRNTNLLNRTWTAAEAGTGLVYQYGKGNNIQIGADVQRGQLSLRGDTTSNLTRTYFLPRASLRLRSGKGFYGLRYNTDVTAPSIQQLQTIARPSVPGRVAIGNVDLTPSVSHRLDGNLWYNDQFRAISANAYVSLGYTDNAFGNELTFTPGQQIYRTINVSHAWNTQVYAGTTIGMEFIKGELRINGNGSSSVGQGFVEGVARTNTTTNYSGTVDVTTEFSETSFLKAGYTYARNGNRFDDDESEEIVTVTHDLVTQLEFEVGEKVRLESRFLYRIFEAAAFAGATNIPDLRASIEWRPFTKGHYFLLAGEDLLNQNTVINRQAQAFVTSETVSNGLGRYFLLTFHYQL